MLRGCPNYSRIATDTAADANVGASLSACQYLSTARTSSFTSIYWPVDAFVVRARGNRQAAFEDATNSVRLGCHRSIRPTANAPWFSVAIVGADCASPGDVDWFQSKGNYLLV
jgi:hypothetical protein